MALDSSDPGQKSYECSHISWSMLIALSPGRSCVQRSGHVIILATPPWRVLSELCDRPLVNILPGMNAGASTYAVPSPIKGSGTAWVLLGSWALSPARPTPIHPRHECRGLSALFGEKVTERACVQGASYHR